MFAFILRTLPPSANYVFYVLDRLGPMPRYSILDETNLPDRTLGYALDILLKRGLVVRMLDKKDARLRIYQIPSPIIIT
ncbi:MAG: MarR family transcriptional regulator [Candidatus Heimdallarchaeota archaeon]|nr:MarR family transcriptional regulator [Candidatus Heimdallarchaeota archaeon]MCK5183575.1 MarR family transcriptional regulator [Candidatus Heimdallarchaeota archaeon]